MVTFHANSIKCHVLSHIQCTKDSEEAFSFVAQTVIKYSWLVLIIIAQSSFDFLGGEPGDIKPVQIQLSNSTSQT